MKQLEEITFVQLVDPLTGAVTQRLPATVCACGDIVLGAASGRISCPTCDRDLTVRTHLQLVLFRSSHHRDIKPENMSEVAG